MKCFYIVSRASFMALMEKGVNDYLSVPFLQNHRFPAMPAWFWKNSIGRFLTLHF